MDHDSEMESKAEEKKGGQGVENQILGFALLERKCL